MARVNLKRIETSTCSIINIYLFIIIIYFWAAYGAIRDQPKNRGHENQSSRQRVRHLIRMVLINSAYCAISCDFLVTCSTWKKNTQTSTSFGSAEVSMQWRYSSALFFLLQQCSLIMPSNHVECPSSIIVIIVQFIHSGMFRFRGMSELRQVQFQFHKL